MWCFRSLSLSHTHFLLLVRNELCLHWTEAERCTRHGRSALCATKVDIMDVENRWYWSQFTCLPANVAIASFSSMHYLSSGATSAAVFFFFQISTPLRQKYTLHLNCRHKTLILFKSNTLVYKSASSAPQMPSEKYEMFRHLHSTVGALQVM